MASTNSKLWQNYESFARERGRLVVHILSQYIDVADSIILDFGAGTGGISLECARARAIVHALEPNVEKAEFLRQQATSEKLNVTLLPSLPKNLQYDAIIVLDVIEHLLEPGLWLQNLHRRLKPDGVIYLCTPNKFSPAHMLVDPHFSLPLLALARRETVKRIVADLLKWQPPQRQDFPELFSFSQLKHLLDAAGFHFTFVNRAVVDYALRHPRSVWNRELHLRLVTFIQRWGKRPLNMLISDDDGFYNKWLNPTWYMMLQKKPGSK